LSGILEGSQWFESKRRATSHPVDAKSAGPGHAESPVQPVDKASYGVHLVKRLLSRRSGNWAFVWTHGGLLSFQAESPRAVTRWQVHTDKSPGGPITIELRVNERIRVPEVRLVGPNGEQVGIVRIEDALRLAQEADLDLVEVAATARPPVCKLMDFGKYKYETAQKARESRRNQTNTVIKEMKLRPKIDPHDYETKKGHVVRFLRAGDKVKITIMFRGREQSRPELGFRLLQRLAEDVSELGFVESSPRQDGRNMIMVLGPHKKKSEARVDVEAEKAKKAAEREAEVEAERAERAEQVQQHEAEIAAGATKKPKGPADNLDPE